MRFFKSLIIFAALSTLLVGSAFANTFSSLRATGAASQAGNASVFLVQCKAHLYNAMIIKRAVNQDPAASCETVAKQLSQITVLNLSMMPYFGKYRGLTSVGALQGLTNLQSLSLAGDNGITNGSGQAIASLTGLKKLNLADTSITELPSLANLKTLVYINLNTVNGVNSIDFLAQDPQLQSLAVVFNMSVTKPDLSVLGNLTQLRLLAIVGNNFNQSITLPSLSRLTRLLSLSILNYAFVFNSPVGINNFQTIGQLSSLVNLNLLGFSVPDLAPIGKLHHLMSLILNSNWLDHKGTPYQLGNLSALLSLQNLQKLAIDGYPHALQTKEIPPLAELPYLNSVSFTYDNISDTSMFANFSHDALYLQHNAISNVKPLAGTTYSYINLNQNNLTLKQCRDQLAGSENVRYCDTIINPASTSVG